MHMKFDDELAFRAGGNLTNWPNVAVHHRSGRGGPICPKCDVIYVSGGGDHRPSIVGWMPSRPGGRFDLSPHPIRWGFGGMLVGLHELAGINPARFICQCDVLSRAWGARGRGHRERAFAGV